jgi:hypothetical protein
LLAGRELGPVHADLFVTTDLLGEHGGQVYDLKLAWPFVWPDLQLVPQIELAQYSADYVDHYYGVTPAEATADRPAYSPGGALVLSAGFDLTWRFQPNWYFRASLSLDQLPDEITASPVVGIDKGWRGGIGIAYDTGNFVRLGQGAPGFSDSSFDASVEVFRMHAESVVTLPSSDADGGVRLEKSSNLDDRDTALPVELTWRIGRYHALGLRYFELFRSGSTELLAPRLIDGEDFAAGDVLATRFATRVLRVDYGFAIFRDVQKELMVRAGVHVTRLELDIDGGTARVGGETNAILPLAGASLRANFTERLALHVALELFALDFDRYSGELSDLSFEGRYALTSTFDVGGGYRWYRESLESNDDSLAGDLEIEYRGPFVSITATFR